MDNLMFYWLKCVTKNYTNFNGRARRKEFWMFALVNVIISIIISIIGAIIGSTLGSILSGIFSLAMLLPGLAVSVRRLHDIDKSGYLVLLGLIPVVGAVILLIWTIQPGMTTENQYGPDPKSLPEDDIDIKFGGDK
jgi:uncharacterized membrane protein YhaH (DUF805 family)